MDNRQDNLLGAVSSIFRNKKFLIRLAFLTGAATAAVSFLMPNYYASTATFYPASPELAKPELIFGYTSTVTEYFGTEHDLDRLLTISQGRELADFMVKKFRLYEHYDIDSTKLKSPQKVRDRFWELFKVEKTKADAIEITVEDTDREYAALMVNAAMQRINETAARTVRESMASQISAIENNLFEKEKTLRSLSDSLGILKKKYGIIDVGAQGVALTELATRAESDASRGRSRLEELEKDPLIPRDTITYLRANVQAAEKELFDLTDPASKKQLNLTRFNDGMLPVQELSDQHYQARKQLTFDLERLRQIRAAYVTPVSAIHVIQTGETPVVKSRPVRSILILAAMIGAVIFGILGLLLAENYRGVDWEKVVRGERL